MQLLDLPEDIMVLIIRKLDFCSQNNLYNSCKTLRNAVSLYGVVKECNMSLNVMATAHTLKLSFFKDISNHLLELNMRAVPDLSKTKVLPAFKKLKRLKTLDISYTNLTLQNLLEIYNVCPTIKDVTVNFVFEQSDKPVKKKTWLQYQSLFNNFENVHLVGCLITLMISKLVLCILGKSEFHTLKFSVVQMDNEHSVNNLVPLDFCKEDFDQNSDCQIPKFKHFAIYLINWKSNVTYNHNSFPILSMIGLKNYEFCVISASSLHIKKVCATKIFQNILSEKFDIYIECVTGYNRCIVGNTAIMIWNRETTQFDDNFFCNFYKHVKKYFPFYHRALTEETCPQEYDWIYTEPRAQNEDSDDDDNDDEYNYRNKKMVPMPMLVLDYSNLLKDKHEVQMSLVFNSHVRTGLKLLEGGDFCTKLTFISLTGLAVYYTSNFFDVLFRCCTNLVTFTVGSPTISSCGNSVSRGVSISKSLKNLRLIDKGLKFPVLFEGFSKCRTLENINLQDQRQWEHCKIIDPSKVLENCPNLYCFFIDAPFSVTAQSQQLKLLKTAKIKYNRHHLKIVVNDVSIHNSPFKYNYSPFLEVFQINSIKPI